MIYIFCGAIITVIGFLFLTKPAKEPSFLYGYTSYLATVTPEAFRLAQKWSRNTMLVCGPLQILVGFLIYRLGADRYILIWLLTFYIFILPIYVVTETKLKHYLEAEGQLPEDYVAPDDQPLKKGGRFFERHTKERRK